MVKLFTVLIAALLVLTMPVSVLAADQPTLGEQNALKKAGSYLKYSAFSQTRLIDQLEYEGFSTSEATYAVKNVKADWMEQAAKKAKQYLKYSAYSRSRLISQLEYEGFTNDQIMYAIGQVGY